MDRISPLPPFWSKNMKLPSCCSSFRGILRSQRRIQSIFQRFFLQREWLPGKPHCCPRTVRRQGAPAQTFVGFYLLGGNFLSSRSGLFVFPPDRRKLLCNIQEVTFIRLNSISKIKSMEKQILVLDGKCWH